MYGLAEMDWNAVFTPANMPIIAVFGMVTAVTVSGIIAGIWQKVRNHERDVQLKRDLIARGYSADEIERIVSAKPGKGKG